MQQEHLCSGPALFQQQHRARIHLSIGSASRKWRSWVTKKPPRPSSLPELWGPGLCKFHPSFLKAWLPKGSNREMEKTHTSTQRWPFISPEMVSVCLPWKVCPTDLIPRRSLRWLFNGLKKVLLEIVRVEAWTLWKFCTENVGYT